MNEFYAIVIYRCLIALSGAMSIYLGFRLFFVVTQRQGEIILRSGKEYHLTMRDVAPGTFFALFGVVVLTVSLVKPLEYDQRQGVTEAAGKVSSQRLLETEGALPIEPKRTAKPQATIEGAPQQLERDKQMEERRTFRGSNELKRDNDINDLKVKPRGQ